MSTFVLIHGAWHGAWCWHKLTPLLEAGGHTVIAPDLPGAGIDQTPLAEVTLAAYADRVCEALGAAREPAVLVGHSMGGLAITQAAERMPRKVKLLVYLTAFLLPTGRTLLDEAQADAAAEVMSNLEFGPGQASASVRAAAQTSVFYDDCSPADLALARTLLRAQPAAPFATPVDVTAERWGSVPRAYIECADDRAISLACQQSMHARLPCRDVARLDSSHSPFLSCPTVLAEHLLTLAAR